MMFRYKRLLTGLFVGIVLVAGVRVYKKKAYKKTDGFSVSTIQFDLPYNSRWEIEELPQRNRKQLEDILDKQFHYLSKGARSYAFVSNDGAYVLKFFKYRYHTPHWTVRYLPAIQPFEYFRQKKVNKVSLDTVLTGYKNAYQYDPEGTGTLFVHLNQSENKYPTIILLDKVGKRHVVDLDHTRFVLQRKAKELSEVLVELLRKNKIDEAKLRIAQTIDLYLSHYQKGLYDLGTGIIRNNGFIGEKPIHFDVGKLTLDERVRDPGFQQAALVIMMRNADKWLEENFPQHRVEIIEDIEQKFNQIFGESVSIHQGKDL